MGLRHYWYPVMFSRQLGRRPRSITLLGERIVLVRDRGRAHALHDRCPHRGIRLSSGAVQFPGTITCPYHGWTYDLASGDLVAVLTDGPDSPMCGRANVATYPVEDRGGMLWVYVGDGTPPPVETDVPDDLLAPDTTVVGKVQLRRGNWRYGLEASMDEAHAKYLHRRAPWQFFRRQAAWTQQVTARPSDDGLWLMRLRSNVVWQSDYPVVGRWPRRQGWWRFVRSRGGGSVSLGVRLPCISRVMQPRWPTFEIFVPVDRDHHLAVLLIAKRGGPLARALMHVEYWTYIRWLYHNHFNGQDQKMIQQMEIPPERLFRPDVIITAWRQWCRDKARQPDAGQAVPPGPRADDLASGAARAAARPEVSSRAAAPTGGGD